MKPAQSKNWIAEIMFAFLATSVFLAGLLNLTGGIYLADIKKNILMAISVFIMTFALNRTLAVEENKQLKS